MSVVILESAAKIGTMVAVGALLLAGIALFMSGEDNLGLGPLFVLIPLGFLSALFGLISSIVGYRRGTPNAEDWLMVTCLIVVLCVVLGYGLWELVYGISGLSNF
jgi:hypothetical protein